MREAEGRPGVAVLVPALDEEATLPGLLEALPRPFVDEVVVVDNGSTDDTAGAALRAGATLVREPERGYGAACLAGIRELAGRERPPRALVFLDADHAEGPARVAELARPVLDGEADLVLAVRRRPEGGTGTALAHARLGNRLVLGVAALLFGRRWRDLPPFRAVDFDRLLALDMDDRTWGWTLQMQLRAEAEGLRVREVEMPHGRRTVGESKISGSALTSVRVGLVMFRTLLRERWRALRRR